MWYAIIIQNKHKVILLDNAALKVYEDLQQHFYKKYGMQFINSIIKKQEELLNKNKDSPYLGIKNLTTKIKECNSFLKEKQ